MESINNNNNIFKKITGKWNTLINQGRLAYSMTTKRTGDVFVTTIIINGKEYKSTGFSRSVNSECNAKGLVLLDNIRVSNNMKPPLAEPQGDKTQKLDDADIAPTIDIDRAENTVLIHQRDPSESCMARPKGSEQTAFGSKPVDLREFVNRWNIMKKGEISTSDPRGKLLETIQFPKDYVLAMKTNPLYRALQQYAYMRPDMEIKIVFNSTKFHQGLVLLAARYGQLMTRNTEGVDRINNAIQLQQMNHVEINAATSNTGTLKLPFVSQFDMIGTNKQSQISPLYYVTVYLGVLSPLMTGASNQQKISYTIFARFLPTTRFYGQRTLVEPDYKPVNGRTIRVLNYSNEDIILTWYNKNTGGSIYSTKLSQTYSYDNTSYYYSEAEADPRFALAIYAASDTPSAVDQTMDFSGIDNIVLSPKAKIKSLKATYEVLGQTTNLTLEQRKTWFHTTEVFSGYSTLIITYVELSSSSIGEPQGLSESIFDSMDDQISSHLNMTVAQVGTGYVTYNGKSNQTYIHEKMEEGKQYAEELYHNTTDWLDYVSPFLPDGGAISMGRNIGSNLIFGNNPSGFATGVIKQAAWSGAKMGFEKALPNINEANITQAITGTIFDSFSGVPLRESLARAGEHLLWSPLASPQGDSAPRMVGTTEDSIPPEHRQAWREARPDVRSGEVSSHPWLSLRRPVTGNFADLNRDNKTISSEPIPAYLQTTPSLSKGLGSQFYRKLKLDHTGETVHPIGTVPEETENQFSFAYLKKVKSLVGVIKITKDTPVGSIVGRIPITPNQGFYSRTTDGKVVMVPSTLAVLASNFVLRSGDIKYTFKAVKTPMHSFRLGFVVSPDIVPTESTVEDFPKVIFDYEEENEITITAPYYAPTKQAPMFEESYPKNRSEQNRAVHFGYLFVYLASDLITMEALSPEVEILIYQHGADNYQNHVPQTSKLMYPSAASTVSRSSKRPVAVPQMESEARTDIERDFDPEIPARAIYSSIHGAEQIDLSSLLKRSNLVYQQKVTIADTYMYAEFDPKLTSFKPTERGKTYPILNQMADAFVFTRGSQRYLISLRSQSQLHMRVIHYPYSVTYRDTFEFASATTIDFDDYGNNLAQELINTQLQTTIPIEVPYVQPVGMLLNGGDPTTEGVYGASTHANGVIRIIIEGPKDTTFDFELYSLMGDDTRMYLFQGFPEMQYPVSSVDTDTNMVNCETFNGCGVIKSGFPSEKSDDANLSAFNQIKQYALENNDRVMYKDACASLRRYTLEKRKMSKGKGMLKYTRMLSNIAMPQGDETIKDVFNIPFSLAGLISKAKGTVNETTNVLGTIKEAASSITNTSDKFNNLFDNLSSGLSSSFNSITSFVNQLTNGAQSFNCLSSIVHIYNIFKSNSITMGIVNFVGFLSSIGFNVLNVCSDFISKIMNFFTTAEPQDESDSKIMSYLKMFVPIIVAYFNFKGAKLTDNIYKKMADSFKSYIWCGTQLDRFLKMNLEIIQRTIYYLLGWENPDQVALQMIKEKSNEISEWAKRVLQLSDPCYKSEIETNANIQKEIVELWEKGNDFVTYPIDRPELKSIAISINLIYKKANDLHNLLSAKVASGYNLEPISFWFFGGAGLGKSRMRDDMIEQLGRAMKIVCNGDPCYVRNTADKYWSGYSDQPFVTYDDWGQITDPTVMISLLEDWWGLLTTAEYTANFAELGDKGRVVAPACVLSYSNVGYPKPSMIASTEALWRRRDKLIQVELSDEFQARFPNQRVINSQFMLDNPNWSERIKKHEHLKFYFCDPLNPTAAKSKPMNYIELMSDLCAFASRTYMMRRDDSIVKAKKGSPLSADKWVDFLTEKIENAEHVDEVGKSAAMASNKMADRVGTRTTEEVFSVHDLASGLGFPQSDFEDCYKVDLNLNEEQKKHFNSVHAYIDDLFNKITVKQNMCVCDNYKLVKSFHENVEGLDLKQFDKCLHKASNFWRGQVCAEHQTMQVVEIQGDYFSMRFAPCGSADCIFVDYVTSDISFTDGRDMSRTNYVTMYDRSDLNHTKMQKKFAVCYALDEPDHSLYKTLCSALRTIASGTYDLFKTGSKIVIATIISIGIIKVLLKAIGLFMSITGSTQNLVGSAVTTTIGGAVGGANVALGTSLLTSFGMSNNVGQAQLAASGDVRTSASRMNRARIARPQSNYTDFAKLVSRNTFFMTGSSQTKNHTIRCLGVGGRWSLVPRHFFDWVTSEKVFMRMYNGGTVEIYKNDLEIKYFNDIDICAVKIPAKLPCFKKIIHLLPTIEEIDNINAACTLIEVPKDDGVLTFTDFTSINFVDRVFAYDINDKLVDRKLVGVSYPKEGKGMCGSVLMDVPHGRIFAMHLMGYGGMGHGCFIFREMFADIADDLIDVVDLKEPFNGTKLPIDGDFIPVSTLADAQQVSQPIKSQICESVCFGVLGEPTRFPVEFRKKGEAKPGYTALATGINKHVPTHPFRKDLREKVSKHLSRYLINNCKPMIKPQSVRSMQTAIEGIDSIPFFDSIRLNTSPGYPLNSQYKGSKKSTFIQRQGNHTVIDRKILDIYNREHNLRLSKTIPDTVYFNFLKDERLKPGKDARLINGCSLTETIEWRRYCNDFFASFQNAGRDVGCGIGMNIHSLAWNDLATRLLSVNSNIMTADYTAFGNTNDPQIVDIICSAVCDWYSYYTDCDPVDNDVRRCLFETIMFVKQVAGDCVVQTLQGFPSGNPYTAPINTLVNKCYIWLAWLEKFEGTEYFSLDVFDRSTYFCFYGDDLIGAVKPELQEQFNNIELINIMNKHGIKMTDALKRGDIVKYDNISDASFLKCNFVKHPHYGVYLSGLDKKVITDIPSWIRKPCNDVVEQSRINCEQAIMFAHGWGLEYFEHVRQTLETFWSQYGKPLSVKEWSEYDQLFMNADTTVSTDAKVFI